MSAQGGSQPGRDPADLIIIETLDGVRQPNVEDAETIIARMAAVPFDTRRRVLPKPLADLIQRHGYALHARPTELTHHWAKHVLGDGQWDSVTTEGLYFQDLQNAIQHEESQLYLWRDPRGQHFAIIVAITVECVPDARLGSQSGPEILVVYWADIGKIVSGYMVASSVRNTSRPGTIWLPR